MADDTHYDVAIVGAGINGAGIARDAALRGLRVVVLEQNDVCSGTSAWSSRLIHGGLRYLEYGEIPLVYESLHERRNLRRIAAHLVRPLRICIPIYEGARRGPLLIRLGMISYDLLSVGKRMPRHDMLNRKEMLEETPALAKEGLRAGACYYDAQVNYAERLVLENVLAARAAGASVLTYHRVTDIDAGPDKPVAILALDRHANREVRVTADVIVNAAGPWVDEVLGRAAENPVTLIGGTKGSHIVVAPFPGAPIDAFYVEAKSDGRPFFILPWNNQLLIGTTDIRYCDSLDEVRASREEVDYLLAETNRVFPHANLDVASIHYAYAGVRPLPRREKGPESAITRKHIIKINKDIAPQLISIIGGKLTTYRNLAEQTVDKLAKVLSRRLPACRTHDTPLPGGWGLEEARERLAADGIVSAAGVERLLSVYGGRAVQLAGLYAADRSLARCIDADRRVLAAEVVFAFRDELAKTLSDVVHRRLMLGLEADQGRPLYDAIAELAAETANWDAARQREELDALCRYSDSFRVGA